jgi:hypothetical protein
MANQSPFVWDETFYANEDLSSSQFFIVKSTGVSGSNKLAALCSSSTGTGTACGIGVIQNAPTSTHAVTVRLAGRSIIVASSSSTISYGAYITSSSEGKALTCATSGDHVLGIARSASTGGAGQRIEADLFMGGFNYVIGG